MDREGLIYHHLVDGIAQASGDLINIPYQPFCEIMLDFSRVFEGMGKALAFAFSDISTKARIIQKNFETCPHFTGLQEMILDEVNRGTEQVHTSDQASTARTVLRLMWFLNFLVEIISHLRTDKTSKLSKITKQAYDSALAPHHPWPVRLGAAIGIKTVPRREVFVQNIFGSGKSEEEIDQMFGIISESVIPMRDALWRFYEEHSLTTLP